MPSRRIQPSKNQIQHTPPPEAEAVAALVPPDLAPRILKFMLEDINSKKLPTSPITNDDIITFWNYTLIKLGEKFKLNHLGPNNLRHPRNGQTFIVVSKTKWCVLAYLESDETIILKIPAKSIKFLEEVQDPNVIDFAERDFCYIKSTYYRSPYKENKFFLIESKKNNYVTVDPVTSPNVVIREPENLNGFDITMNKKLKIKTRGWKQKIPFSELRFLEPSLNEDLKLLYLLGI